MKLTPRCQGYRFRDPKWPEGRYYDVRFVGRSTVRVIDQDRKGIEFDRDDTKGDWVRLGSTKSFKGKK